MKLIAGALAGMAAAAVAVAAPSAALAKGCPAGQKSATIGGKQTCVGIGATCATKYDSQYEKLGYTCEYLSGKYKLARKPTHGGGY